MTRYLLDTNIVSNVTKPVPSPSLLAWMAAQSNLDLFICAFTIAEIRRGVLRMPPGRRRGSFEDWFAGPESPHSVFAGRVLPFDGAAALIWARLMADGDSAGRPRSALDMIVAATAIANDCIIVTGNVRHFTGLPTFNPLRESPG